MILYSKSHEGPSHNELHHIERWLAMTFQVAYLQWLKQEKKKSSPERRRRLHPQLGHAEETFLHNVWWPIHGNFDYLHPEYEVADFSGAGRFIDFAYIRNDIRLAIEIDGFTSHAQNINRHQFSYQLRRQNVLTVDGWDILRFSFDDIQEQPRRCQVTMQQYIGSRFAISLHDAHSTPVVTAIEREVVRLARSLPRPIRPRDIQRHLGMSRGTVYRHIHRLVERGWLVPASGKERIRSYELAKTVRFGNMM